MLQTTFYQAEYKPENVTVIYFFNHSRMGFSNEITVNAISNIFFTCLIGYNITGKETGYKDNNFFK